MGLPAIEYDQKRGISNISKEFVLGNWKDKSYQLLSWRRPTGADLEMQIPNLVLDMTTSMHLFGI